MIIFSGGKILEAFLCYVELSVVFHTICHYIELFVSLFSICSPCVDFVIRFYFTSDFPMNAMYLCTCVCIVCVRVCACVCACAYAYSVRKCLHIVIISQYIQCRHMNGPSPVTPH